MCQTIKKILLVFCFLSTFFQGLGQVTDQEWSILNRQYREGKLKDTAYLNKILSLAEKSFKDIKLKDKLAGFKLIVWGNDQYQPYKIQYYSILGNNAAFTHKPGTVIYYLQKLETELKKTSPYVNSLNEPRQLLAIYGKNERTNIEKRKAVFKNTLPFLKNLPQLILDQEVPANTCTNAMTILAHASRLYNDTSGTLMLKEIAAISQKILTGLKIKNNLSNDKMLQCLYLYYQVRYTEALGNKDFSVSRRMLDTSYIILHSDTAIRKVWARSAERSLLRKYIDFFISQQQMDSSKRYMQLLAEKINQSDPGDGTAYLLYAAKVNAMEQNFKQAYSDLLLAYEINDSIINLETADINNNMYALLVSEQKQEEVILLKEQKQKRGLFIAIVSFIAIASISLLVLQMRRKEKSAKQKIEALNKLTQIEIAELEMKANAIQRKMGMDLHDDIAGRLVFLCYFIDKQIIEQSQSNNTKHLQAIRDLAADAYQNTRSKSHEWFTKAQQEEQQSFSESVHRMANYALPGERYEKTIEIDDNSLHKVSYKLRIELLCIVQEAFINILKHSGANKIQLFIYEEDNTIVVQIKDNGKGFGSKGTLSGKGIGLRSLQDRVQRMNGSIDINSSNNGVELTITAPVF